MNSWDSIKEEYSDALARLEEYAKEVNADPKWSEVFKAIDLCPFDKVKVVILGQDPPANGQADGLAFSSKTKVTPSLNILYRELQRTHGFLNTSPNLDAWAKQGVLLLNTTLTVTPGQPNSHQAIGWEPFVGACLMALRDETSPVFVAMGASAKAFYSICGINKKTARVIESAHPSPLARGTFVGNNIFKRIDSELDRRGESKIEWRI